MSKNDDEWVKEGIIRDVRNGARISRSGAWLAERDEHTGEIEVYKHTETIEE